YRAFTSAMDDRLQLSATSGYYLGEVILSAADFEIDGFLSAKKANTLPVDSNAELFSLVGNSFGGDSASFILPVLSSLQLPRNRTLDYQISTSGVVPARADKAAQSHTVGSIKYLEIPVRSISDVGSYLHVGDIFMAKGLDGGFGASRDMLPCDGRTLGHTLNKDLYSLLGDRFTDTTEVGLFNIPDLTGVAPIEGASYFIVVNGALPPRR
ncbi:MAG: tail fiber protein, partial [Thermoleophilia bacterium]|nr:tail fiber protein [Thermoleophilia bacterium]